MRKFPVLVAAATALAATGLAHAALSPLSTFGGGDGWLAPGEGGYAYLTTANTERGLAYNPVTGNVLLVSRQNVGGVSNNIRILNPLTGTDVGGLDVTSGVAISGGTFPINMVDVADDGAIYVGNLSTSATSNFKVYRWANQAASATLAHDAVSGLARTGDSFAVTGSGAGTKIGAAGGTTVNASNFAILNTADGSTYTATAYTSIPGTTTTSNDYRLGMTFVDSDTLIGAQGGPARVTDFGASATVTASIPLGVAQRLVDYAVIGGIPFLAAVDTNSSLVQIFDVTDPTMPILYDSLTTTSGTLTSNGNGVGDVAWGAIVGNSATLYAMSTNQGIQAMTFVVPEPATMGVLGLAAAGMLRRRRA